MDRGKISFFLYWNILVERLLETVQCYIKDYYVIQRHRCFKKVISRNDSSVELKSESLSHHLLYSMEKDILANFSLYFA